MVDAFHWRHEAVALLQRSLDDAGIPTVRAAGRSPLDVTISEAYRCTSRDQLAAWVDGALESNDEVRRRVCARAIGRRGVSRADWPAFCGYAKAPE